ncbi:MAG: hypothetical protein P4L87_25030 [Formivibrio sp.]|nr:hypothetical protein [Formivibrio sp.]
MNRAQRRAAARAKPQQILNRDAAVKAFNTRLALANATQAGDEDCSHLITPLFVLVEKLMAGKLDTTGFIELNESNCGAFCLAKEIHTWAANDGTRDQVVPSMPIFEAAADALGDIGERFVLRGHYIATMTEIEAIRASINWFDALIRVADRSHLTRALLEAAKMVDEKLLKVGRAA